MILVSTLGFISVPTFSARGRSKKVQPSYRREFMLELHQVSDFKASKSTLRSHNGNARRCDCFDLYDELVPYNEAWSCQKYLVREKQALMETNEDYTDTLIILQHPPVYTLGTGSSEEYLNFNMNDAPHDVYRTERGGEVTYHGPGQLVMYPIINLRYHKMDLHWYLRALEEVVIRTLSSTFSIKASRLEGFTGVWVVSLLTEHKPKSLSFLMVNMFADMLRGNQKLAAIGIRASQWIAYHGLALNVATDLTPFEHIIPCGIRNRQVGSIKSLIGGHGFPDGGGIQDIHLAEACQLVDMAHRSLLKEFSEVFQLTLHPRPVSDFKNLKEISSSLLTGKCL